MDAIERLRQIAYRVLGISETVRFTQELDWFVDRKATQTLRMGQDTCIEKPILQLDGPSRITLGDHTTVGRFAWLSAYESYRDQRFTPQIDIGSNVYIGNFACITSTHRITIGDGCLISQHVYISDHVHGFDAASGLPVCQALENKGPIVIGMGCFIGYRASILPGAMLGERCVVGAHAVVNKPFPAYSMIVGQPARIIRQYSFETMRWEDVE